MKYLLKSQVISYTVFHYKISSKCNLLQYPKVKSTDDHDYPQRHTISRNTLLIFLDFASCCFTPLSPFLEMYKVPKHLEIRDRSIFLPFSSPFLHCKGGLQKDRRTAGFHQTLSCIHILLGRCSGTQ